MAKRVGAGMNDIMIVVVIITVALFDILAFVFLMVRFTDMQKQIKDIADNQFDAEEVMKVYRMKYEPKPQIIREKKNIVDLFARYNLPYEYRNEVSEEEIYNKLAKDMAQEIGMYMEVMANKDIVNMDVVYTARLQVVDNRKL